MKDLHRDAKRTLSKYAFPAKIFSLQFKQVVSRLFQVAIFFKRLESSVALIGTKDPEEHQDEIVEVPITNAKR